jgi:hypothetical protein
MSSYLAALKANGGPGSDIRTASGTIPGYVHPPAELSPGGSAGGVKVSTAETRASPREQPY